MTGESSNTQDLLYQTLPNRVSVDEWDIRYAEELDTGLTQKFAARHKITSRRGVVKCGWPGTIVKRSLAAYRAQPESARPRRPNWRRSRMRYCGAGCSCFVREQGPLTSPPAAHWILRRPPILLYTNVCLPLLKDAGSL